MQNRTASRTCLTDRGPAKRAGKGSAMPPVVGWLRAQIDPPSSSARGGGYRGSPGVGKGLRERHRNSRLGKVRRDGKGGRGSSWCKKI
jgi:hypothetical protein